MLFSATQESNTGDTEKKQVLRQLGGQPADYSKLRKQNSPCALKSGDLGSRPVTLTLGKSCLTSETH